VEIEDRTLPTVGAAGTHDHDTATLMLGLPGFRVLAVGEVDGELQVQVETTADLVGCPSCAAVAVLHDRRLRFVRDLPAGGRPVLLCWSKRVALPAPAVPSGDVLRADSGGPTEGYADRAGPGRGVPPRRTRRAQRGPGRDRSGGGVADGDAGGHRVRPAHPRRRLGGSGRGAPGGRRDGVPGRNRPPSHPVRDRLVDLGPAGGGPARLLDVVQGRSGAVVTDWLTDRGAAWCAGVAGRGPGPVSGLRHHDHDNALRTGLPTAAVVLDPFHAIKVAQNTIDTVRRRVQTDTLGHRGRRGNPLYGIRRVLLRGAERHTLTSYTRLTAPGSS